MGKNDSPGNIRFGIFFQLQWVIASVFHAALVLFISLYWEYVCIFEQCSDLLITLWKSIFLLFGSLPFVFFELLLNFFYFRLPFNKRIIATILAGFVGPVLIIMLLEAVRPYFSSVIGRLSYENTNIVNGFIYLSTFVFLSVIPLWVLQRFLFSRFVKDTISTLSYVITFVLSAVTILFFFVPLSWWITEHIEEDIGGFEPHKMIKCDWQRDAEAWIDINVNGKWDEFERPLAGVKFYVNREMFYIPDPVESDSFGRAHLSYTTYSVPYANRCETEKIDVTLDVPTGYCLTTPGFVQSSMADERKLLFGFIPCEKPSSYPNPGAR